MIGNAYNIIILTEALDKIHLCELILWYNAYNLKWKSTNELLRAFSSELMICLHLCRILSRLTVFSSPEPKTQVSHFDYPILRRPSSSLPFNFDFSNRFIDFMNTLKAARQKGRDLTQSYDKTPTPTEKSKKHRDNITNPTKNCDYTTIADRLRTVGWCNSCYPNGVVKPVYERSTFQLTATAVKSKGHTFNNFSTTLLIVTEDQQPTKSEMS